jgi:hypothetical protein
MMQKNLKQRCRFHPCPASTILVLTNVRACSRTTPMYPETPKHFQFESSHPRWRTLSDLCQSPHYNLERILVQTRVPANGRVAAPRAGRSLENRHLCCCCSPHRQTWNCNRHISTQLLLAKKSYCSTTVAPNPKRKHVFMLRRWGVL